MMVSGANRYSWYKEHNICPYCKTNNPPSRYVICEACRKYIKATRALLDESKKRIIREKARIRVKEVVNDRISKGLCRWCGEPVSELDKRHCEKHRLYMVEKKREATKKKRAERESAVLKHLDKTCSECEYYNERDSTCEVKKIVSNVKATKYACKSFGKKVNNDT